LMIGATKAEVAEELVLERVEQEAAQLVLLTLVLELGERKMTIASSSPLPLLLRNRNFNASRNQK